MESAHALDAIRVEVVGEKPSPTDAVGRLDSGTSPIGGGRGTATEVVTLAVDDVAKGLQSISTAVVTAMERIAPDSWSVELNVGFKAGSGVPVLMSGEANAALKVTLNWKRSEAR
jgi:hypothetical protein